MKSLNITVIICITALLFAFILKLNIPVHWVKICLLASIVYLLIYNITKQILNSKQNKIAHNIKLNLDLYERIVVDGAAKVGNEKTVGKIFLTNSRLIYICGYSGSQTSFPLGEILHLEPYKLFGFFSVGIKVHSNKTERTFVLDYPKDWIQLIYYQKNNNKAW